MLVRWTLIMFCISISVWAADSDLNRPSAGWQNEQPEYNRHPPRYQIMTRDRPAQSPVGAPRSKSKVKAEPRLEVRARDEASPPQSGPPSSQSIFSGPVTLGSSSSAESGQVVKEMGSAIQSHGGDPGIELAADSVMGQMLKRQAALHSLLGPARSAKVSALAADTEFTSRMGALLGHPHLKWLLAGQLVLLLVFFAFGAWWRSRIKSWKGRLGARALLVVSYTVCTVTLLPYSILGEPYLQVMKGLLGALI